jgi:hypothetical protein
MTPKEKAKELVGKYVFYTVTDFSDNNFEQTKQCALIAVNEMLSNDGWSSSLDEWNTFKNYFEKVKQEIQKL